MFSRSRRSYDPGVYLSEAPERANRRGEKLVLDMKAFRNHTTAGEDQKRRQSFNESRRSLRPRQNSHLDGHDLAVQEFKEQWERDWDFQDDRDVAESSRSSSQSDGKGQEARNGPEALSIHDRLPEVSAVSSGAQLVAVPRPFILVPPAPMPSVSISLLSVPHLARNERNESERENLRSNASENNEQRKTTLVSEQRGKSLTFTRFGKKITSFISRLVSAEQAVVDQAQSEPENQNNFTRADRLQRGAPAQEVAISHMAAREAENIQDVQPTEATQTEESFAASIAHGQSLFTECVCCGDTKSTAASFPAHPPTYACEHPCQTCTECMQLWLASEFAGKGSKSLHCPECLRVMEYEDVSRGASEETREAYDRRLFLMALSEEREFAWCLAPKCNFGQLNEDSGNYMECAACRYRQCLKHKSAWHAGETCAVYDARVQFVDASEVATSAMIDQVSKICPGKGCGWRIQKGDG